MREFVGGLILALAVIAMLLGLVFLVRAIDEDRANSELKTARATIATGFFALAGVLVLTVIMGHLAEIVQSNAAIAERMGRIDGLRADRSQES